MIVQYVVSVCVDTKDNIKLNSPLLSDSCNMLLLYLSRHAEVCFVLNRPQIKRSQSEFPASLSTEQPSYVAPRMVSSVSENENPIASG